jgi:hypothetical protein
MQTLNQRCISGFSAQICLLVGKDSVDCAGIAAAYEIKANQCRGSDDPALHHSIELFSYKRARMSP